ncbi:retrovirus-related pol polyprotein from transposon TNT 1-94 [Tanacetum coccineum]
MNTSPIHIESPPSTSQPFSPTSSSPAPTHTPTSSPTHSPNLTPTSSSPTQSQTPLTTPTQSPSSNQTPSPSTQSQTTPTPPPIPQRVSTRNKQQPTKLSDYHCTLPPSISKHHHSNFLYYTNLTKSSLHFINSIDRSVEPHTYFQASKDPKWVEAMNKELQALEDNHTWTFTLLPQGKSPIGTKMVTVRTLLAINNAFLHGDLHKDVYMTIPQGYPHPLPQWIL